MPLESTFDFPDDLNQANPLDGDDIDEGAAHLRGLKRVIQNLARDFDGNPIDQSIFNAFYPVGTCVIASGGEGDPGNKVGGTWVRFGQLKSLTTAEEDPSAPGALPNSYLYVWYRTA